MIKNIYSATLLAGAVATLGLTVSRPDLIAVPIAATGAALTAVSVTEERRRIGETKVREASKVATAFQASYSKNKGLVQAEEISIFGEIPLERAVAFLNALAQENNGYPLPNSEGRAYVFPHPENTIETLTRNAQEWAKTQVDQAAAENQQLKQTIGIMQQQFTANFAAQSSMDRQIERTEQRRKAPGADPWDNLL